MLKYYHRGLLHKKWKAYRFVLYDSSLLTWYADVKHKKPDGMVLMKDVERFICVGPYTRCLPDFPHLENECDQVALIAFPMSIKDRDREIVWVLCEDMDDLNSWMKAIVQTLPSHTLHMEKLANTSSSSSSMDEEVRTESHIYSPSSHLTEAITVKASSVRLPLAAALLGTRLQGHSMNSKASPLQKAGYDYGDTLRGTGEGWGHFSMLSTPGYAGLGGSGCYSNHIDLIRTEDDEPRLKDVEDRIDENMNDEDVVAEATYELSKKKYAGGDDDEDTPSNHEDESDEREEPDERSDEEEEEEDHRDIDEDLQMIDSELDK